MDVSVLNFDEASLGYLLLAHRPLFSIEREVFSLFLDKLSMPAMETAIGAASRGVPFFGKVGEDMLKELQKNREQLKELSNIVNQKL